ncbi:F0F1 ATP synthase subunit delta [Endozoicomonas sp. (ex Bugula neritina AB1)]|nr:F0F1 ATP synthase subunit delta [Endozoicomonas sp. (ex Bugula neritina AB1)]
MELTTCARPYAKAAFEYARQASALNEWAQMLSLCVSVSQDEKVKQMLSNPGLSGVQQADIFLDLCQGELNSHGENFIRTLSENRRLSLLSEIELLFVQLKAEEEKAQDVDVTSAFPLTKIQQNKLAEKMKARLGCSVRLNTEVDSRLIGGVIVKAGDLVIDGSLRARLTKLADTMMS